MPFGFAKPGGAESPGGGPEERPGGSPDVSPGGEAGLPFDCGCPLSPLSTCDSLSKGSFGGGGVFEGTGAAGLAPATESEGNSASSNRVVFWAPLPLATDAQLELGVASAFLLLGEFNL